VKVPLPQPLLRQFLSCTWKSSITNGAVSIKNGVPPRLVYFLRWAVTFVRIVSIPGLTWHSVCYGYVVYLRQLSIERILWRFSFLLEWSQCVQVEQIVYMTKYKSWAEKAVVGESTNPIRSFARMLVLRITRQ
jgi:hypothetical protein